MQISWKGQACFYVIAQRTKQEQVKILIDPFDSSIGLKMPMMAADMVLSTHDHEGHHNLKAAGEDAFALVGPGEYELKDVVVQGIRSFHDDVQGKEQGANTIYTIEAEGIKLCHLGDLGQRELAADQVSKIGSVDILFVPVGGVSTIGAKAASKIVHQIEPRIVVPMHYSLSALRGKLEKVDDFLKEMGVKSVEPQGKLSVKLRDLPAEETKVIVLTP